jgi:penicillin-binding protein 1A
MRLALAQSKNVIAVRLLKSIGLDQAIGHLSSFGFAPDELPRNESLALGSASLTPLEVVTGFATFANGGFLIDPYLIERIETAEGDIVFQASPNLACDPCEFHSQAIKTPEAIVGQNYINDSDYENKTPEINSAPRVISEQNAFLITQALNSAIWGVDWAAENPWRGTGWRAKELKRKDIAGKTGTTNEGKDAWFSGFSRRLVTTSWIGFDDPGRNLGKSIYNSNLGKNQITGTEAGAKSAQPAWIDFMRVALTEIDTENFEPPAEIVSVLIDKVTGKLSTNTNKSSMFEYFQLGTAPTEYVSQDNSIDIFQSDDVNKNEEGELF